MAAPPVWNRLQLTRLRRLGAEQQRVPVDDGDVGALSLAGSGDGPPVVLVHGLGAWGGAYLRLVQGLLPRVRQIVLPDFPGHGLSADWSGPLTTRAVVRAMSQAVPQLLDAPAVLYGNSLGGYGALWTASDTPSCAAGVAVTSPAGGALPDDLRHEVLQRFLPENHAQAVDLVDRSMTSVGPWTRHAAAVGARLMLQRPIVQTLARSVEPDDDLRPEQLERLTMPLRVYWGTGERALHPRQREWFRTWLPPHAELHEPEGWGHAAFRERTNEVLAALLDFVDVVEGRKAAIAGDEEGG